MDGFEIYFEDEATRLTDGLGKKKKNQGLNSRVGSEAIIEDWEDWEGTGWRVGEN